MIVHISDQGDCSKSASSNYYKDIGQYHYKNILLFIGLGYLELKLLGHLTTLNQHEATFL